MTLVLASTSIYRRQLMERLGLPFEVFRPDIDETPLQGEHPESLAHRLARAKAAAAKTQFRDGLAIGSDQVASTGAELLGKPGTHDNAVAQLMILSGQAVDFFTSVCVLDLASGRSEIELARTVVKFRQLDEGIIEDYLRREPAYDCAGSFKSEGLGITLLESIREDDPTALVGLPLIRLCRLLRNFGISV